MSVLFGLYVGYCAHDSCSHVDKKKITCTQRGKVPPGILSTSTPVTVAYAYSHLRFSFRVAGRSRYWNGRHANGHGRLRSGQRRRVHTRHPFFMSCLLRARDPSRISSPLSIIQPLSFLDETPLTGTHTRHCTRVNGKSTMQRPVCMSQAIYPPCVGVAAACVRHPRDHVASFCPTYEKGSLKKTLYV